MLMMVTNLKAINHPRYVRLIKLLAALLVPQTHMAQIYFAPPFPLLNG